jgi:hypothetical protein
MLARLCDDTANDHSSVHPANGALKEERFFIKLTTLEIYAQYGNSYTFSGI